MLARTLVVLAFMSAPLAAQARGAPDAATPSISAGTFLAERIDRESLPQTDRVVDTDGTIYLIVFDRLALSLRADKSFRASVRYRRTLYSADPRGRNRTIPLQTMSVTGTYELVGNVIKFNPDPSEDARGLRILEGIVVGPREISLPFHYRNGNTDRDRTLVMRRNDNVL